MSLRWVWSLLAALAIAVVGLWMSLAFLQVEKSSWRSSEMEQNHRLIALLSRELKLPMMVNSRTETVNIIETWMQQTPNARIYLQWNSGEEELYRIAQRPIFITNLTHWAKKPLDIEGAEHWSAMAITYNSTELGHIALYNITHEWADMSSPIKWRLFGIVLVMSMLIAAATYAATGRIRHNLLLLANASQKVAQGDFSIYLPIQTSDEFGTTFYQFNQMMTKLEQREKIHDLYGNYANPQKVADVHDRKEHRDATILAIHITGMSADITHHHGDGLHQLNDYFAIFEHIIQTFDGHVDHFSGDTLVAVFNHPFDLKCHENQAAKAGVAIARSAAHFSDHAVQFRVAMAVGDILIGYLGTGRRRQLSIAGEPVSIAIQLARNINSQQLITPHRTTLLLRHGFRPQGMGNCKLSNGTDIRCVNLLASEDYIEQKVEEALKAAFMAVQPQHIAAR